MKLVVDTNVFISGVFFSGPPHDILNAWRHGTSCHLRIQGNYSPHSEAYSRPIPEIE